MGLWKCGHCGAFVSTLIGTCHHCGASAPGGFLPKSTRDVQAIARPGRLWKAAQLLGGLIALASVPTCLAGASLAHRHGLHGMVSRVMALSGLIGFAGIGLYAVARLGAWWFHG